MLGARLGFMGQLGSVVVVLSLISGYDLLYPKP